MRGEDVLAILVSDLHLSHDAPLARAVEPDWYRAQLRQLDELWMLAGMRTHSGEDTPREHHLPIICAGDVFDRWNAPAQLINFALDHLPPLYAIPGQHDLPYHNYKGIHKSAYWTLVQAGKITNLVPGKPLEVPGTSVRLHAFPWGFDLEPLQNPRDLCLEVAVVHVYVWGKSTCYPGAPETGYFRRVQDKLRGHDLIVAGDNHKSFQTGFKKEGGVPPLYNCGGFLRRKSDEVDHRPSAGLLHADGSVSRHYFDCGQDRFTDVTVVTEALSGIGADTFAEELSSLARAAVDYAEAVRRLLGRDKVPQGIRQMALHFLGRGEGK